MAPNIVCVSSSRIARSAPVLCPAMYRRRRISQERPRAVPCKCNVQTQPCTSSHKLNGGCIYHHCALSVGLTLADNID